jgi:hypothetical protein
MTESKSLIRLTKVAKWLFVAAVILLAFAWGAELRSDNSDGQGPSVFFYVHCGILLFCLVVATFVKYFQNKYRTEAKGEFYQATNCALWWTGIGILYFSIGYLLTIAGFIFLIFAFFLWLEVIRQAYHLREPASHDTR